MKISKTTGVIVSLSMCIFGLALLYYAVASDIPDVEIKHIIAVIIAIAFYGVSGWLWFNHKE